MNIRSIIPFGRSSNLPSYGAEADPFVSMRREMDRLFDVFSQDWPFTQDSSQRTGFLSPKVDIAEDEKGLEITADLPGIDQKDISLELENDILTLRAEHSEQKEEKNEKRHYHLIERTSGTFMRRFAMPFPADKDKVEAKFERGVLKVTIPRMPQPEKQVQKIEIR